MSKNTKQPASDFMAWAMAASPALRFGMPVMTSMSSTELWDVNASMTSCNSTEDASRSPLSPGRSLVMMSSICPLSHRSMNTSAYSGSNCFPRPSTSSWRMWF